MLTLIDKITELLNKRFEDENYQHLFLVDIKHLAGDVIQVFIESDNALTFEHCVATSRFLEEHIEENQWLGEKYTLDVSSPGVGADLKLKRQYLKNIGRLVSVELKEEHKNVKGKLTTVEDEFIVVQYEEKVKVEGRKKKELVVFNKEILFDNIVRTKVKISFS